MYYVYIWQWSVKHCWKYHTTITLVILKAQLLLLADDLVFTSSDCESGLQNSMNRLDEFCKTWDLKINTEKTKVVVFNEPRSQQIPIFKMEWTLTEWMQVLPECRVQWKMNSISFLIAHLYSSIKEKSDFLSYYSLLNPAFTNLNKMEIYFTNNRQSFDTDIPRRCMHKKWPCIFKFIIMIMMIEPGKPISHIHTKNKMPGTLIDCILSLWSSNANLPKHDYSLLHCLSIGGDANVRQLPGWLKSNVISAFLSCPSFLVAEKKV